jgi:hypothetical protein
MTEDIHDQLMKAVLDYLAASEFFEQRPSEARKRMARRELRKLIKLARARQDEIRTQYKDVLEDHRKNHKWQVHRKNPTT